jgi:hypothetical protein
LQISTSDNPADPTTWGWDVYSYLLLSYIAVLVLPKKSFVRWPLAVASAAVLCIPYEQYAAFLKIPDAVQFSGWNLMPWLGLPILFHSAGVLWSQKNPDFFKAMRKWEWPVWITLIALICAITPDYGPFPAGPGFEAYVFKIKPLMFWKHFLVFSFLMRLSLDPMINATLAKMKGMNWLSNLAWNKHLGVAYFMHLAFLPMGQHLMEFWGNYPGTFDWLWLFIFVSVELIVRAMFAMRLTVRAKALQLIGRKAI